MKQSTQYANNRNKKLYYSFTTFLLFVFFIQLAITTVVNVTKIISYNQKYHKLTLCNIEAKILQDKLRTEIDNFSAEEIARNKLKMAEKNELIVMFNNDPLQAQKKAQNNFRYY